MQRGNARAAARRLKIREDNPQRTQALHDRIDTENEVRREMHRRLQISNLRVWWMENKDSLLRAQQLLYQDRPAASVTEVK